jgi:hypothetical protein
MSGNVLNLEYPVSIVGADGTAVWTGCGFVKDQTIVLNSDAAAITPGDAVGWDQANTIIQAWSQASTVAPRKQVLKGLRAITTGNKDMFIGVAIKPAAVGAFVAVATDGSVVAVKATADGTEQQNCIGSTTAGQVTAQDALATAPNGTLGKVIKIRGATGGTTDSGSTTQLICAIGIN